MFKKPVSRITGVLLFLCVHSAGAQTFQNLDFEAAQIQPDPYGRYGYISLNAGLPSWTCYYGTNVAVSGFFNSVSLGSYMVSLLGPDLNMGGNIKVLNGYYSPVLQAGWAPPVGSANLPASIAQSGLVPMGVHSLQMEVRAFTPSSLSGFQVTLGTQVIPMVTLGTTPDYTIIGGDISGFTGQVEELGISALPLPSYANNSIEVDAIQFSPQAIPEPGLELLFVSVASGSLVRRHRPNRES